MRHQWVPIAIAALAACQPVAEDHGDWPDEGFGATPTGVTGQAPAPGDLAIDVGYLIRGGSGSVDISGGSDGERAFLVWSLGGAGDGDCPGALGGQCLGMLDPWGLLDSVVLDANGDGSLTFDVPLGNGNAVEVCWQSVIRRGTGNADTELSDVVCVTADVDDNDDGVPDALEEVSNGNTCDAAYADLDICNAWLVNTTETAPWIDDGNTLVDVQAVTSTTVNGVAYASISATGIPGYAWTLSADEEAWLTSRPLAATDFVTSSPTVSAGDWIEFGMDVGYSSSNQCVADEGYGFWPPGPACPSDQAATLLIPLEPTPSTESCSIGSGSSGFLLNGVSLYGWGDTFSYGTETWYNLAGVQEAYDLDLCMGHAAGTQYHHHNPSPCVVDLFDDDGSAHSALFGFMGDGYPIYGYWHADGVEAQSCWVYRDYDDANDPYACGGTGERDCVMVDEYDPSQGTVAAGEDGPSTSDTVTSLSGNSFSGDQGLFYEDYYFDSDCTALGGQFLDEHNGHDHDDFGYHYHLTNSFPFTPGPEFYGEIPADSTVQCGDPFSTGGGTGGPPTGGPP